MRGGFVDQGGLFSYIAPEARVPANHPLRKIRELVRDVLGELNRSLGRLYASEGRPSIPPEQLLSALLLQVFYGIRSERQLMEQLDYNLLYRWFVGLSPDDPIWDPTSFDCRTARCLPERQHHLDRQAPPERHRRTHHAARRPRHVAIAPGDDRMHLRLGQTAWHDAQDKTSRHGQCRYRFFCSI